MRSVWQMCVIAVLSVSCCHIAVLPPEALIKKHEQLSRKSKKPFDLFYVVNDIDDPNEALVLVKYFVERLDCAPNCKTSEPQESPNATKCGLQAPCYETILFCALEKVCYHGDDFLPIFKYLVSRGASLNYEHKVYGNLIMRAVCPCDGRSLEALKFLLKHCRMSPNYVGGANRESAIATAASQRNSYEFIREFIRYGADVNLGRPILRAMEHRDADSFEALLKAGAKLDEEGGTPILCYATKAACTCCLATDGQDRIVKALLELGFDATKRDKDGKTALDYALTSPETSNSHTKALSLLKLACSVK